MGIEDSQFPGEGNAVFCCLVLHVVSDNGLDRSFNPMLLLIAYLDVEVVDSWRCKERPIYSGYIL